MPVKTPLPYHPYIKLEQTIRISLKAPVENSFAAVTLPTTEPVDGQFKRTLLAGDFYEITPSDCYRLDIFYLAIVGYCPTAATIYWRMRKNGAIVASGSFAVSAANYYRIYAIWQGIAVGDIVELRLWSSVADSRYDYTGWQIHPSRVCTVESLNSPCSVSFEGLVAAPVWTGTNAPTGTVTTTGFAAQHLDATLATVTAATAYDILFPRVTNRLFRTAYGDTTAPINTASTATATTRALTQLRSWIPTMLKLKVWKLW